MNSFLRKLITPVAVFAASLGVALSMANQRDVVGAEAATQTWQEVTVAPADWSGQYLIVSKTDNVAFNGSLAKLDAESNTIAVTISAGQISLDDSYSFTISAHTGGNYDIKSASGNYIYNTSASKNALKTSTTIPTETNTISLSTNKIIILSSNYLVYNSTSNQTRFRYYKAATSDYGNGKDAYHAISLYKKVEVTDRVTALTVSPSAKSYYTSSTLMEADFAVSVTKNGSAGTSADYTAKIGTGTGGTFTGTDIVWGTTQPTTANTTIQFKSKYPTIAGGSTYLTADVALTVNESLLDSISVTTQPTKKTYNTNDEFDPTGMVVTASYNNGTSQTISNSSLSFSPSPLTEGTTTVTISYTEGSVTKTATISGLTVLTKTLNSISINTATSKLSFTLGETFVYPGLVIDAHYNGGTEEITSGFSVNGVDTMILGPQTATITFEEMTTSYAINVTNEGASVGPASTTNDLFISEWIEPSKGNGNNKFIEIYNPLAEAVDLSTYTMKAFPNGADTASATLALTGTLAAGETIVIYNEQQTIITTEEIPSTWISQSYPGLTDFNGDDTFGLFKNDVLIDLVGEIGVDPGTEWSGLDFLGASVQTIDSNWTRHGSITVPNATFTMAEWVVGPWDTHTLGSHTHAYNDVTALEQATAYANYVWSGRGDFEQGTCVEVLADLEAEYGYMSTDAKNLFDGSTDELFINAQYRLSYLRAWVAANSPGGTANPLDLASNTSITLLIGILGLTSVVGFYLVSKKKYEN